MSELTPPNAWCKTLDEGVATTVGTLKLFVEPGQITELRALGVKSKYGRPHVESGFFDYDHLADMAKIALKTTRDAKGVYFTINPLKRDLLARRCNRTDRAEEGELAKDKDVLKRRWLLIDVDPVRDPHISSNDEEKAAAYETILAIREHLRDEGWGSPILADSGNGYHAFFPIDLPTEDGGLVKQMLEALAHQFDNDRVKVDRSVHNPARICKLPGTAARKGDHTTDRPHRWGKILEVPE